MNLSRNIVRGLSILFLLSAAAFAASLALTIWRGQMWTCGIYVGGPRLHLIGLVLSALGAYVFARGIHNTPRDRLAFAARMILFATSCVLAFAIAEIGLRVFLAHRQKDESLDRLREMRESGKPLPVISTHPLSSLIQPSDDPRLVYELQPKLDVEFGPVRVRTNKIGLRSDADVDLARAPRSVRIVGLGDSGMFGWDVDAGQCYLSVLELRLRARNDGVRYEVMNFAVPGYNTRLEVEMLRSKALAYHPDLVVVGWCENDFGLPLFLLQKQDYRRRDVSFVYRLLFDRAKFAELAPGFSVQDRRGMETDQLTPEMTAGVDEAGVRAALAELAALSRENGFRILVFGPMKAPVVAMCKDLGIPYCCIYEKIPADKYPADYAVFYMHPRPGGHRALAECLERELDERGWLKPHN